MLEALIRGYHTLTPPQWLMEGGGLAGDEMRNHNYPPFASL